MKKFTVKFSAIILVMTTIILSLASCKKNDIFTDETLQEVESIKLTEPKLKKPLTDYARENPAECGDPREFIDKLMNKSGEDKDNILAFLKSVKLEETTPDIENSHSETEYTPILTLIYKDGTQLAIRYTDTKLEVYKIGEAQNLKEYKVKTKKFREKLLKEFGIELKGDEIKIK